jgi:hypothetical protein
MYMEEISKRCEHAFIAGYTVAIILLTAMAWVFFIGPLVEHERGIALASTLSIEEPPMEGHALNLSRDEMDRDLTIDPDANFTGTQELPTEGATDIDINQIPPAGVSIIISNETVVVTKEPVTVG